MTLGEGLSGELGWGGHCQSVRQERGRQTLKECSWCPLPSWRSGQHWPLLISALKVVSENFFFTLQFGGWVKKRLGSASLNPGWSFSRIGCYTQIDATLLSTCQG